MEIGEEFLNFHFNQKSESITRKITLKLVSLPSSRFCFSLQPCRRLSKIGKLKRPFMDLGDAISELETLVWNLGDL